MRGGARITLKTFREKLWGKSKRFWGKSKRRRLTAKQQNMMNRIMATSRLGEGETRQNIKTHNILNKITKPYEKKTRRVVNITKTRKSRKNKSNEQADATLAVVNLYEDVVIAIELFNNIYMPNAPDEETLNEYAATVQDIEDIKYKIKRMVDKFEQGKMPKSKKINKLRTKLSDAFEDIGLDDEDIETAKNEKKFDVSDEMEELFKGMHL
jgi:hypothetical protein